MRTLAEVEESMTAKSKGSKGKKKGKDGKREDSRGKGSYREDTKGSDWESGIAKKGKGHPTWANHTVSIKGVMVFENKW